MQGISNHRMGEWKNRGHHVRMGFHSAELIKASNALHDLLKKSRLFVDTGMRFGPYEKICSKRWSGEDALGKRSGV